MKILILGATGRTGKLILKEALNHKYHVHVLVRDKTKLNANSKNLAVFEGTPTDKKSLREAMKGCNAVISALNISRTSDFPWARLRTPKTFLSDTMQNIINLCEELSISRVIIMSAWGVGNSWSSLPKWFRWIIQNSNISHAYKDHEAQENLLKSSSLHWTCIRPVGLTNSKTIKTGKVSIDGNKRPSLMISRRSVAKFIMDQVMKKDFILQTPVLFH